MPHTNSINHQPSTINQIPSTINSSYSISILASPSQKSELHHSPLFRQHKLLYAENLHEMVNQKADAYMDLLFEEDEFGSGEMNIHKSYTGSSGANAESHGAKAESSGANAESYRANAESSGANAESYRAKAESSGAKAESAGANAESGNENAVRPDIKRIQLLAGLLPSPVFINSVIHTLSDLHPDLIRINAWPGFLESSLLEAAASADSIAKARHIFGDKILFVKDVPGFVNPRIISMIINEAFYTLGAGTSSREEIDIAMKLGTGYPLGPFEWAEKIGHRRVAALLAVLGDVAGNLLMVDG